MNWESNGALEMRFDAYLKRQFIAESNNINILMDHPIWSTIKNLPATLPEPRSVVRGPSYDAQGPNFTDHCPAATDRGPGLLRAFLCQLWTLLKGVGRRARALVRGSRTFWDKQFNCSIFA